MTTASRPQASAEPAGSSTGARHSDGGPNRMYSGIGVLILKSLAS